MHTISYEVTQIESIEFLGEYEDDVYDVGMVDTPHTFFANGILVHNSSFVSAVPVIKSMEEKLGKQLSFDEKANLTFKTALAIENYINDSFTEYAQKYHNVTEHFLTIKQEYVATAGFWVAKKRYAQKIVMEKGVSIDNMTGGKKKWKLDVKGMDVVRSNFPKAFREFMSGMLISILDGEPKETLDAAIKKLRDEIESKPLLDIMLPTGVKEISKFGFDKSNPFLRFKGTPAHVKSALNYNALLLHYNLIGTAPITDGTKIKWSKLKTNPLNLESLAITGINDPKEIVDYLTKYVDKEAIFISALENKLQDFYNALGFGPVTTNENLEDFFTF